MKKVLSAIFVIFTINIAWAAPEHATFSIKCKDSAGTLCYEISDPNNEITGINGCSTSNQNLNLDINKAFLIDIATTGKCLNRYITNFEKKCKNVQRSFFNSTNKLLLSCADNIQYTLTSDSKVHQTRAETANLSYNERLCRSSGGIYGKNIVGNQNGCLCANNAMANGTYSFEEDLGCVYTTNNNIKYIGTTSGYGGELSEALCTASGGTPKSDKCICAENKHLVPNGDSQKSCKCADNYMFLNPMDKQLGCVQKNEIFTISGTVFNSSDTPIPNVNISYYDTKDTQQYTTSDNNGKFNIIDLPNVSYVIFSHAKYKTSIYSAVDLKGNNNRITLQTNDPHTKNIQEGEIETPTSSECDGGKVKNAAGECVDKSDENADDTCKKSGGASQTDGTCTCDPNKNLKPNEDATKCICADDFSRETETDPCTPTEKGGSGAEAETDKTATELEDKLKSAQNALTKAKEAENSWANRGVTAASSAMTGLGGMAAASALAEQRADAEAEKQMRAYIETMKCEYGNGQNVKLGNEEITLPGGNELLDYYSEYKQLADNLKATKSALGLRSGIESEVLYDRAQSGLYQYASIGKTGGAETSLYRALTDKESEDASTWAEQKEKTDKKLLTGGLVAAAGVATGVIGNYLLNERGKNHENLKQEFKKKKESLKNRYPNDIIELEPKNFAAKSLTNFSNSIPSPKESEAISTLISDTEYPDFAFSSESLFENGKFSIKQDNQALEEYTNFIKEVLSNEDFSEMSICFTVTGHTDRTPVKNNSKYYKDNQELSELRAKSIADYMNKQLHGISNIKEIRSVGKGDTECVDSKYPTGKEKECRRVDVKAYDCPQGE